MKIRKGTKKDIPKCLKFYEEMGGKELAKRAKKHIKSMVLIVAEEKGTIVGFLTYYDNYINDMIYINQLLLEKSERGYSAQRKLVAWLKEYAKKNKMSKIFSDLEPKKLPNISIYRSLGFRPAGEIMGWGRRGRKAQILAYKVIR